MARLRYDRALTTLAALALAWLGPAAALAQEGLYDRPVLVLDPGMHTAPIRRADVDAAGEYAVTGSEDKTVRVWSVADGELLQTIRLPAGPGNVGKVYAVAIDPNGELIAAGGWLTDGPPTHIDLFDRATGDLTQRIEGLPETVKHLTFSPDGRYLAATLGGANGLRVYDLEVGWAEVARDSDYGDQSYGAAFAADGRLATTSFDGQVRLYDPGFELITAQETAGGQKPFGTAFSPDGSRLAVGFRDTTNVEILDGRTLEPLPSPDTSGINNGDLSKVAWSADGATLFAAESYGPGKHAQVVAWDDAGAGRQPRALPAGQSTVMSLVPLADGGLLVAAGDPYLAILDADGTPRWANEPEQADLRAQYELRVSSDGPTVDFGYAMWGKIPARFDVATLNLALDPPEDGLTETPEHDALPLDGWKNTTYLTLEGVPLRLKPYERSRSLAIHPDGDRFVLGAEFRLRAYDDEGEQIWRSDVPGVVWAVNISGDGRLVVAAYADGTIRWHRMDDGKELLAFFPLADRTNWVAWTPEGIYAATPGAHGVLKWHVNRGWDQAAEAIPVSRIPEQRRPEVLPLVLQEMDVVAALGLAELNEIRTAVQRRTRSDVPPGAQLHVLAIGVGDYNEDYAKHLKLDFADGDAHDVAAALVNTQGSLYAKVHPQTLRNENANRGGILRALATMKETMRPDDTAVIHFSGHGALIDDGLYLLPYEVDARDVVGIKASAIGIGDLRRELVALGERGRVLLLLDACRSGAATLDQADLTVDARLLRAALAMTNVTVLTSSAGSEVSREDPKWQNGAFTEAFLEALGRVADTNKNGVVSVNELTGYMTRRVPLLTEWEQTLGIEVRFEHTVFAEGL